MSLKWEPFAVVGAVVTVAVSLAVTLWAGAGLAWPYAALVAMLVTAMMIPLAVRAQDGAARAAGIDLQPGLEASVAGLAHRLQEVERRLVELDERMIDVSRVTVRALATELDQVGSVVRDLAEAVAVLDTELFAPRAAREAAQRDTPPPAAALAPQPQAAARLPMADHDAVVRALRTGNLELMLQAVVTLPQRRVRLYEAQTRARLPGGRFADTARVMEIAETDGLSRELDRFVLQNALKVARHLMARNRDVPVVFRGSASALSDAGLFRLLAEAVAADPAFGSRLLFALPLAVFRDADALEREALDALDQLGIRFVLDEVPDLVFEARSLAARGVRYVRVGAATLLGAASGQVRAEIHPADLAGYLARHGLTLVVDGVTDEQVALEIFEFDVPLGIGPVYAPPRSVRMDVLDEAAALAPADDATPGAGTPTPAAPPAAVAEVAAASSAPAKDIASSAAAEAATPQRSTSLRSFLRRTSG